MSLFLGLICLIILIHLLVEYLIRKFKQSVNPQADNQSTAPDGETNNSEPNASDHSANSNQIYLVTLRPTQLT